MVTISEVSSFAWPTVLVCSLLAVEEVASKLNVASSRKTLSSMTAFRPGNPETRDSSWLVVVVEVEVIAGKKEKMAGDRGWSLIFRTGKRLRFGIFAFVVTEEGTCR